MYPWLLLRRDHMAQLSGHTHSAKSTMMQHHNLNLGYTMPLPTLPLVILSTHHSQIIILEAIFAQMGNLNI